LSALRSSLRIVSTPRCSTCQRVCPSTPAVLDPRLRFTRSHATSNVAGSQSRLNTSPKRLCSSCTVQRCSLVCHPSTRSSAALASSGADVFTPDLPNGFSCCGPAAALPHAAGFSGLGVLRRLRHAPRASADIAPDRPPPAAGHARGASHVHREPFDRVDSRLYPCSASEERSQLPLGHRARIYETGTERAAKHASGTIAASSPHPPGSGPLMRSRGFNHRFAFALPFGLACAHSGVWQCRPAATSSGLLPPQARDPAPRLPPASPGRCIGPGPAFQPARLRVVRPFSPFARRLVAHHRLARVRRVQRALEPAADPERRDGERLLHALAQRRGGAGMGAGEFVGERA
jgi:hypothetical protein